MIRKTTIALGLTAPILATLKRSTSVPIVLPTALMRFRDDRQLEAVIVSSGPAGYRVSIDKAPCHLSPTCHYYTVDGYRERASPAPVGYIKVRLASGTIASFTASVCESSCSESILTWDTADKRRYRVGIEAGSRAEVLKLANSMEAF